MTSKQDAKKEKMLREFARREGNKQCMTCVGHGGRLPQYACVDFGTFVCTACSGVHREFQFKVKSIGNSLFKDEEVALMGEIGNDAARAQFLAGWYGTENERGCPMVDNTKRAPLQNFIRQVFVERRFEGQRAAPVPAAAMPAPTPQVTQQLSFGSFMAPGGQVQQPQQAQQQFHQPQVPSPAPAQADPFGLGGFVTPAPADAQSQLAGVFGGAVTTSVAAVVPINAPPTTTNGGFVGGNGWDAFSNTPAAAMKPPETAQTLNVFAIPAPAPAPAATMVHPAPAPAPAAHDMFGSMQITPPAAAPAAPAAAPTAAAPDMFGNIFAAPAQPAAPAAAPAAAPDMFGAMTMTPPAPAPTQSQTQAQNPPGDMFDSMNVAPPAAAAQAVPATAPAAAPAARQMISDDLFSGGQPGGMVQPGFGGMMGGMMGGAPQKPQQPQQPQQPQAVGVAGMSGGGFIAAPQTSFSGQMSFQSMSAPTQPQYGQTAPDQYGQFGNGSAVGGGGIGGMQGMPGGPGMGFGAPSMSSGFGGSTVDPPTSPDPFGDLGASIGVSAPKPKPKPKEPEPSGMSMGGMGAGFGRGMVMPGQMNGAHMGGMMMSGQGMSGGQQMQGMFGRQLGMNPQLQQQQMVMMRQQQMMAQQQGMQGMQGMQPGMQPPQQQQPGGYAQSNQAGGYAQSNPFANM